MAVADGIGLDPIQLAADFDRELDRRAGPINRYWDYYRGEAHVLYATVKFRQHFGRLLSEISDNWCSVVVDSAVERLRVTGFRFGADENADDEAWDIWQANSLDADQVLAHEEAGVSTLCYLLVEPPDERRDYPRISPLSPLEAVTLNSPEDARDRVAAYRRWVDEDGVPQARLYLPDRWIVLVGGDQGRTGAALGADSSPSARFGTWQVADEYPNAAGVVPMVEMVNKPHLGRGGESDLDPILSKQDMVNKLATDMIVNSEFTAYAQRWATGIQLASDDEGHPIPPEQFLADVSRVWFNENPEGRFGALPSGDGSVFVRQIEMLVQHIAAQTRTPPHYLTAGLGQWPSADSLRASEEGLVQKCRRKALGFGESWEEAMRVGFLYLGDAERGRAHRLEVLWADPQRVSIAQITDAAVKARTSLQVPRRATWRMLGASPQEIEEWEAELAEEPPEPEATAPSSASLPGPPTET